MADSNRNETDQFIKSLKTESKGILVELMAEKSTSVRGIAARLELRRRENIALAKRANRALVVSIIAIAVAIMSLGLPYLGFDMKTISADSESGYSWIAGEYKSEILGTKFVYDLRQDYTVVLRQGDSYEYIQFVGSWSKSSEANKLMISLGKPTGNMKKVVEIFSEGLEDTLNIEGDDLISEKFQTRFRRIE